jgi:NAD-dependent dihydropyrimidine dehydrogenase PreA subunit
VRKDGIFIAVEIDNAAVADAELARKLTEACPVDIFAEGQSGVEIVQENIDECVLCRLCLDASDGWGSGTVVKIVKLSEDGAVLA